MRNLFIRFYFSRGVFGSLWFLGRRYDNGKDKDGGSIGKEMENGSEWIIIYFNYV